MTSSEPTPTIRAVASQLYDLWARDTDVITIEPPFEKLTQPDQDSWVADAREALRPVRGLLSKLAVEFRTSDGSQEDLAHILDSLTQALEVQDTDVVPEV